MKILKQKRDEPLSYNHAQRDEYQLVLDELKKESGGTTIEKVVIVIGSGNLDFNESRYIDSRVEGYYNTEITHEDNKG